MARSSIYPPSVTPGIPNLDSLPTGWIETTFGNVLKPISRRIKMHDAEIYTLVTAKRNRGGIILRANLTGKEIKTKSQFKICKNDFLISRRQIIHGACGIVPTHLDGAIVSNEYSCLRVKEGILLAYLNYYSHSVHFQQTCFQASVGVDVEKMIFNLKDWLKMKIHIPPISEQQKIASVLGAYDDAIEQINQLIDLKQQRKKGLMQQLLTGKVRFPEFVQSEEFIDTKIGKLPADWQIVQLGKCAKLTAGGTPSTQKPNYWDGNIKWMKSGDIHLGYIYDVEGRITEEGLKNSSTKMIPSNSVLIALAGQGKTRGTVAVNRVELCTNQSIAAIIPSPKTLHYDYLYRNLENRYQELRRLSTGAGGRGGLNLKLLRSISVPKPSIQEQEHIAQVFEHCDNEITLLQQKLEAFRTQQKGLMQQLLTGKIRVKV